MNPVEPWIPRATCFGLMLCLTPSLNAAPTPDGKVEPPLGFYRGAVHLSIASGNEDDFGGSLIRHEKGIQDGIKAQSVLGYSPMKFFGVRPAPFPLALPVRFVSKSSVQAVAEFGLTDSWGIGLAAHFMEIRSLRQDQGPDLSAGTQAVYTELIPRNALYYEGRDVMLNGSYHFNSASVFDPYVALRAGVVSFRTGYREADASLSYLIGLLSPPRGSGLVAGGAVGVNFFFLKQIALKVELSGYQRWLRSEAFPREKLWSARIDAGATFDFNHIRRM